MAPRRGVPRYQQIFLHLREKILTGKLSPGERISSEAELSREFEVSRITSQRALNELAKAGLVTRARGRGTLVREHVLRRPQIDDTTSEVEITAQLIDQSRIIGQTEARLLTFSREPAPPHVLEKLALEPGSDIYFIERVRSSGGAPFCYLLVYVLEEIGRTFSPAALESRMMLDLIEEAGHEIETFEQVVTASVADAVVADHLEIGAGMPLLSFTRTVYNTDGIPIEYVEASFRPDRFRLSMSLENASSTKRRGRTSAVATGK